MIRRRFMAGMAAVMTAPSVGRAQQAAKIPRIGYLFSFTRAGGEWTSTLLYP